MRRNKCWIVGGIAGVLALSLAAPRAAAQTVKSAPAQRIQSMEGIDTFKAYCAVCHGTQAKGNGPAAAALKKVPADLTTFAKRHGGKFSATDVEEAISGKYESHGSRDMPIWGPVFQAIETDRTFTKMRIQNLVDYLKSIQTQ